MLITIVKDGAYNIKQDLFTEARELWKVSAFSDPVLKGRVQICIKI